MSPEAFGEKFPFLYHLTRSENLQSIYRHGLLSPEDICELYNVETQDRVWYLTQRRAESVLLQKDGLPDSYLSDNRPLSEKALLKCLDDDLSPSDWIAMLNKRVFFWVDTKRFEKLTHGPAHKSQHCIVLKCDTVELLRKHYKAAGISPINTGSTIHKPARRGFRTFAGLYGLNYDEWRHGRPIKTPSRVVEVSFDTSILDIEAYVKDIIEINKAAS